MDMAKNKLTNQWNDVLSFWTYKPWNKDILTACITRIELAVRKSSFVFHFFAFYQSLHKAQNIFTASQAALLAQIPLHILESQQATETQRLYFEN